MALHIAQRASKYQQYEDIKGMYLTEHRRCVPEIINYCNELAYTGRLEPKRNSLESFPLPHMGYAHISGTAERIAGSRQNTTEATVIIKWIQDNQERLKEMYKKQNIKKVGDIIASIIPFLRQKLLIKQELKKIGLEDITVGTVHALQGAERPIVIFSPLYDSNEPKEYFFDSGVNMLNVAVSRAKDSFLVFGDMRIFNKKSTLPSGLLARYLFANESNEIKNIEVPSQFNSDINIPVEHIRDLESHRNILKSSLHMAKKEVHIVSPFLSWNAIEQDELNKLFTDIIYKGIKVHVYTDEQLNEYQGKKRFNFIKAKDVLSTLGVNVHILDRIHNKTLWVDESLLIEGSFNWLSARRKKNDPWCRYETSLLYRGTGVEEMIKKVYKDLRGKEKYSVTSN
ncbi:AAA domain-containing protein [Bacillus tropicus]|uniref:AAA domain-containing protein n=1 Tax=Bacillus tropicus TaxID=2026188 RepID=UPI0035D75930